MEKEVEQLRDEMRRLGVATHAHVSRSEEGQACDSSEFCISEEDFTEAMVVAPGHGHRFHVDTMTAIEVLRADVDGAGRDLVMAELAGIDHGE